MILGFIGAGNMAGAIIEGVVRSGALAPAELHVFDIDGAKVTQMQESLGIVKCETCEEAISSSDMIIMAVKPYQLGAVLGEQQAALKGKAIISIAAGWTTDMLKSAVPADARVMRVMPNTPALVGEGMTVLSRASTFTVEEQDMAYRIFGVIGHVLWLDEHQMEAAIGLSGSGPAYVCMFIEALADGGVSLGLTRVQAMEMAAQTVLGTAKMALSSGKHPGELKDMVCSPGGTTIAAVRTLEKNGLRSAAFEAVVAAAEAAKAMNK